MIAQLACLLILRSSIAADSEQRLRSRPPGNLLKALACLLDLVKKNAIPAISRRNRIV